MQSARFLAVLLLLSLVAPGALAQDEAAVPEAEVAEAGPSFGARLLDMARHREEGAASWQLVPAVLLAYGAGATDNFSAGVSLRLDHMPTGLPLRTGGFFTAEVLADGTVRLAGGMQGGLWLMGCQMGLAYRTATGDRPGAEGFASSLGLHIAKTIDFAGFSIGGRLTIPLADFVDPNGGVTRVQGIEGQVFVTIGASLGLDGAPRSSCGCPHPEPEAETDGAAPSIE